MSGGRIHLFRLKILLFLLLGLGLSKAFFLTIIMGGHYSDLAHDNMVRRVRLEPERGVISDTNGKPLAMNIEINNKTVRYYPPGELVSGLVGYLGRMSDEDVKKCGFGCSTDMYVGKAGLEKQYQEVLYGTAGEAIIRETADASVRNEVSRVESIPGRNLKTNIDLELQKRLFVALKNALSKSGKSASAVITRVSGEVLAMVSLPAYDPNLFVSDGKRSDFGGDYKSVNDLFKDEVKKPLFFRPVLGDYASGSVYKLVPALAALEEKKITRDTVIVDTGEIVVGQYRFGNWLLDKYGKTEGNVDVEMALGRSNDIFFYRIGESLGADSLINWSKRFGLGERTGIDLPGESDGFLPTPYWKEKTSGTKWFLGDTYHLSIGQGDIMTTPIQISRMTAAVISGEKCSLRVVGSDQKCEKLGTGELNRQTILEGMKQACSKGGTAFPLFPYEGQVYCKTGTAQQGGKDDLPHSWLSVVVPEGSSIRNWLVMTILVEAGGEGSAVAGPVAAELMPYILDK